jgi:hypothetical protein
MSKPKKPTGKKTLTIHFDTAKGIKNFVAWYLQSGEQNSRYFSEAWGKDWLYVKTSRTACPKCEYDDDTLLDDLWVNTVYPVLKTECTNCKHVYKVKNPYYKKDNPENYP